MREALSNVTFEERNLEESMLSPEEILAIAEDVKVSVHDLTRPHAPAYKERREELRAMDDKALAEAMSQEPTLIKRPIVQIGEHYVVGLDQAALDQRLQEIQ